MSLSIVIPVYNSENTLNIVIDDILMSDFNKRELEIILVNDYSTDKSKKVCESLFKNHKFIKYIELSKNFGENNAVMAGLKYCTKDYVIIMDDDGQHTSSEALKLYNAICANNDDVVYADYKITKQFYLRKLLSNINLKFCEIFIGSPRGIKLNSFKCFNNFILCNILKYNGPYPYLDGIISRSTSRISKIKIDHKKRLFGKSNYNLRKLFYIWTNIYTNFSLLPLQITIYIGLLTSLVGFIFGIIALYEKIILSHVPSGWTSLAFLICMFGGVQLISIGVIGEYIGRVLHSVSHKPQYIVREQFEHKK